jgi:hypothetical protein
MIVECEVRWSLLSFIYFYSRCRKWLFWRRERKVRRCCYGASTGLKLTIFGTGSTKHSPRDYHYLFSPCLLPAGEVHLFEVGCRFSGRISFWA